MGDTGCIGKFVFSPEIGERLMLPIRTLTRHIGTIDCRCRTNLLIHRNTEQRSKSKINSSKVFTCRFNEYLLRGIVVVIPEHARIHVKRKFLHMVCGKSVKLTMFHKLEIITITILFIANNINHVLLSQWGE